MTSSTRKQSVALLFMSTSFEDLDRHAKLIADIMRLSASTRPDPRRVASAELALRMAEDRLAMADEVDLSPGNSSRYK